jgi:hypothetical protein
MESATFEMIKTFGFPVTIAAFLLWWVHREMERVTKEAGDRERRLSERLDQVQDARTAEMAGVIRDNTAAMRESVDASRGLTAALNARPCMMQDGR